MQACGGKHLNIFQVFFEVFLPKERKRRNITDILNIKPKKVESVTSLTCERNNEESQERHITDVLT